MRIAVIGVGLIGGSIGLAARSRLGAETVGFDTDAGALARARARGAIVHATSSPEEAADDADACFIAAPVGLLPELAGRVLARASADCVVSDVGSTKREVVAAVSDSRFIGGHPMAGAETAGIDNARGDLFEGATWYLTPGGASDAGLQQALTQIVAGLGACPVTIAPQRHDELLARVSHLPHVLANVLMAEAAAVLGPEGRLPATAPSFRDATRVAGANTTIWTDIYMSNRAALGDALDETVARLTHVRELLARGDAAALSAWNEAAASVRRRLNDEPATEGLTTRGGA